MYTFNVYISKIFNLISVFVYSKIHTQVCYIVTLKKSLENSKAQKKTKLVYFNDSRKDKGECTSP